MINKLKTCFCALLISYTSFGSDTDSLFTAGNKAFSNNQFTDAINNYELALNAEKSTILHYNLGNAYYRNKQLGKAILNYEKALRLDPNFTMAQENLAIANARLVDKIDNSKRKNLSSFWSDFKQQIGVNTFGKLVIVFLSIAGFLAILFQLSGSTLVKKWSFFIAIGCAILSLISLYFTLSTNSELKKSNLGIVTTNKVDVVTEPKNDANLSFVLHEGTKVHILSTKGEWTEIAIDNGGVGWVNRTDIENI